MVCKNNLLKYIKDFLDYEITQEEYYELSQICYSEHGDLLKTYYPDFNENFMKVVPDACLYYIDEPGLDDNKKRELFRNLICSLYIID
ncbi:hypothetical protein [Clostridium sp.]|uniref:hypothetical protein n=1 Tax=Clostridium sp. TaxID=1506 RepID=UPI003216C20B